MKFTCDREKIVYWNSNYEDGKQGDYGFYRRVDGNVHTIIKNDIRYKLTFTDGQTSVTEDTGYFSNWNNPTSSDFRDAHWMSYNSNGKAVVFQENETIVVLVCLFQQGVSSQEMYGIKDPADQKVYMKAVFAKDDPHLGGYKECYGD